MTHDAGIEVCMVSQFGTKSEKYVRMDAFCLFSLQENSIVLNGSVMFNATRIPNSVGDVYFDEGLERYKLCMCADGTLFRVQVKYHNMGCQTSENPCRKAH